MQTIKMSIHVREVFYRTNSVIMAYEKLAEAWKIRHTESLWRREIILILPYKWKEQAAKLQL